MKQRLFVLLLITSLGTLTGQAQLKLPKTGLGNIGSLLTQFSGALKPTSLLDSWAGGGKTDWLGLPQGYRWGGLGKSISSLAGFIKPSMFKGGFDVAGLIKTANTVKTISNATGLLKNLEGGLKPEAFSSDWSSKRSGWLSALNLIK
ncbi:hypothetical protein [Paraflavitalea speifideaquila]|uniref:hypothetical protein n=1 Tax=Paraflavitalea speifideaquila TaxID=3076558 RepID=UPI0028ECE3E0|nr:hypothetical protein [Paraflavitalea speifideiaquila]